MLWATVPEAAVDEDRDSLAREGAIRPTPPIGHERGVVNAIAKAGGVKQAADRYLGRCVAAHVRSHDRLGCSVGGPTVRLDLSCSQGTRDLPAQLAHHLASIGRVRTSRLSRPAAGASIEEQKLHK